MIFTISLGHQNPGPGYYQQITVILTNSIISNELNQLKQNLSYQVNLSVVPRII